MTMNNLKKYPSQQEQFARSASARLPRKEEDPSARDGERKREESMKRLLEWKQRMLQSPLTRKMSQQQAQQLGLGSPGSTGNPFLSKSGQLQMEAEMYLEQEKQMQAQHQQQQLQQQQQQKQQQQQMQHLRVDNKSNLEYNSYSSDDEGKSASYLNLPICCRTILLFLSDNQLTIVLAGPSILDCSFLVYISTNQRTENNLSKFAALFPPAPGYNTHTPQLRCWFCFLLFPKTSSFFVALIQVFLTNSGFALKSWFFVIFRCFVDFVLFLVSLRSTVDFLEQQK